MRRLLSALLVSFLAALPVSAQDQDRAATILVLDASGSMWGQIDGINKIVIAREVIGDLLTEIPADMALGLTMYGHNRRGDCSDIETMVEPGLNNRDLIAQIVNEVNPRGRTPLSDAVIQAAEALRYTENPATVILVSDGRETCDADPCAVGRALEEAGIDFTAHVIGFDVSEQEDRAQLQCLAENTGGQFLTASNATELADALQQVVAAPAPPPPATITMQAVVAPDNTAPVSPLVWEVFTSDGQQIIDAIQAPAISAPLPAGDYRIELYRMAEETTHEGVFTVVAGQDQVVTLVLPAAVPGATLSAVDEAPIGSEITVDWTGPNGDGDMIRIARTDGVTVGTGVATTGGSPARITLPGTEGNYIVQYYHAALRLVLAEEPISVTPLPATLDAPTTAPAGATIQVGWTGPDLDSDYIAVSRVDDAAGYVNYTYTREGTPLDLVMPPEPGIYEIRYVLREGRQVIARRQIEVTAVQATLDAPATAAVGETIQVRWTGPDYDNDYIAVSRVDDPTGYENYTYTREGSPLRLVMPTEPGIYEIRYFQRQDRVILAHRQIELTAVQATLDAPATAAVGETIQVGWTGPDYDNDYIAVSRVDDPTGYENYTYTREGSPLRLVMPTEPGIYEIRYFQRQDRVILAHRQIELTAVQATLDAPATAAVGETIQVGWTGPDYDSDYIAVSRVDDPTGYENYTYTREGSPLRLVMPTEPGIYEIRYFQRQDRVILAHRQIELTAVQATLDAPATAVVGDTIQVGWSGPDYDSDYIGVSRIDDPTGYENYTYTREGTPLRLVMPTEPGTYEIRYFVRQDRQIIARHQITLSDVQASLDAPASAPAGTSIQVSWTGPDYASDYIGISRVDDPTGYESYTYTREGSPLSIDLPEEPGIYEIRYFMRQDRRIITHRQIEVAAP